MIPKRKIILMLVLMILLTSFQIDKKIRRIILKEYEKNGGIILPTKLKNENINCELFDGSFLTIQLQDYRGQMVIKHYSKDAILLEEGGYINSLDLLRIYNTSVEMTTGKKEISVIEYYQPLREGMWHFYQKGRIKKTLLYKRGLVDKSTPN